MNESVNRKIAAFLCAMATIMALVVIATLATGSHALNKNNLPKNGLLPSETSWVVADPDGFGEPVQAGAAVKAPDGKLTINASFNPAQTGRDVLLFQSEGQCVRVTVDGETVYNLDAGPNKLKLNARGYSVINLPPSASECSVSITFYDLDDETCMVPPIFNCTPGDAISHLVWLDLPTLVTLPAFAVLLIALIGFIIAMALHGNFESRLASFAVFLLLTCVWSVADMYLLCILPLSEQLVATLDHLLFAMLPLPLLMFIRSSCATKRPRFCCAGGMATATFVIAECILFLAGIICLPDLLVIPQAAMLLTVTYGFVSLARNYKAEKADNMKILLAAFGSATVIGAANIAVYWWGPEGAYRAVYQFNILLFIAFRALGVIQSALASENELKLKNAELDMLRELSFVDALTGLSNRAAFDRDMAAVDKRERDGSRMNLVFLDVNGLKYENDTFGHMAGDELIVASARAIERAFGEAECCYRVGGDEFAVILEGSSADILRLYARLDEEIAAFNQASRRTLTIARGNSPLIDCNGKRQSISNWKAATDKRMYENKVKAHYATTRGSEDDYKEIVMGFVEAVDAKDPYTADHSHRVALLADRICALVGMTEASASQVRMAANLHDIGKIGMPERILCKESSLTVAEWEVMKTHPIVGEGILKHTKAFYEVGQIIRHHHERFDGTGYPDGIAGSTIPVGARIVAIADSIDAITSSRTYRKAMSTDFCRNQIEEGLGTTYDPAIGSIVLEHWTEIEKVLLMHPNDILAASRMEEESRLDEGARRE